MSPKPSRSGPFLVEMTLVILFFAISASVCVSLFAAGYRQSEKEPKPWGARSSWPERSGVYARRG